MADRPHKEVYKELELTSSKIKEQIYHVRTLVSQLGYDPQIRDSMLERIDHIYRDFDAVQEFCKSR